MPRRRTTDAPGIDRRGFLKQAAISSAAIPLAQAGQTTRKVKLGVVGNGGRGAWIANLFKEDGGYEMHAVADYFPDVANRCGDALGVDAKRRFSGLNGYKRLLESGVEAVAFETPPFFFPEHVTAAVDAGLHVYMAKPIAVDVPGVLKVEAEAKKAQGKRCFLVDYQMETDPGNIEVVTQVHAGKIGKVVGLSSHYLANMFSDPPLTKTIESRLQHLVWVNDTAIGASYHGNACIHAVDAAMWVAQQRPVAAMGASRIGRPDPHGDSHDVYSITFEFADGLILNHRAKHIPDGYAAVGFCGCVIDGQSGYAEISYATKATLLAGENAFREDVVNLYELGARRNIAAFHKNIVEADYTNPTVQHAVDSVLAVILGREAARRHTRLTMAALLKENKRLDVDLRSLKA